MSIGEVAIPEEIDENASDIPLGDCFNLLDQGVVPVKPLHQHSSIKTLQKKFLCRIYDKNGGSSEDSMITAAADPFVF